MPPYQTVTTGFVVAIVGFFSSFPIVIQGLVAVGATPSEAASGLFAAALAMGVAGIAMSLTTKAPVSSAWSTPGVALLASTGMIEGGFAAAVGGFVIAGILTVIAGLWRPLAQAVAAVPLALAHAMLAGVLLSICLAPVQAVAQVPWVALPIIVVWFVVGRFNRLAAVPSAVIVATFLTIVAAEQGDLVPNSWVPSIVWVTPVLSVQSALSIGVPLFIVTMATQNAPGFAVLRTNNYAPTPGPLLSTVGGLSVLSAPFGAPATCIAAITAAMCADETAHPDKSKRFWAAVMAGVFYILLGVFAGVIIAFTNAAPPMTLATLAGVALFGVFAGSLSTAVRDADTREAAVVTFLVTASGISVAGIGAAVWGLFVGGLVLALVRMTNQPTG